MAVIIIDATAAFTIVFFDAHAAAIDVAACRFSPLPALLTMFRYHADMLRYAYVIDAISPIYAPDYFSPLIHTPLPLLR